MNAKRSKFRPSVLGLLATLAGVGFFTMLGNWQLGRASEKQSLLEAQASWVGQAALPVSELDSVTAAQRYRPVLAQGRYLGQRQVLIDNQIYNGQAGYRVLTPLITEIDEGIVLVDRGWVSAGGTREVLPNPPPPAGFLTLQGELDNPPRMALRLGSSIVAQDGWPLLLVDFDVGEISQRLEREVFPMILRLAQDQPGRLLMPPSAVAQFGPGRHLSYAVQWFALAAAVVIIFLVMSWERRDGSH